MSFASIDRAFAAGLLGVDPSKLLPGEPESQGFRAPAFDAQEGDQLLCGRRSLRIAGKPIEVPVYRFSNRGRRVVENWPAFSFELIGVMFNPQRYIFGPGDKIREPVRSSMVDVELSGGRTVRGPSLHLVREHPDPYDLMYDVRVYIKDRWQQMELLELLLSQFPARGALHGVLDSGVRKSWELRINSVVNVDDQEPTLDTGTHGYAWVNTYVVETHLDNSMVAKLERTILSPPELDLVEHAPVQQRAAPLLYLTVTPSNPVVLKGHPLEFVALATYADGVQVDVTTHATWRASDPSLLTPQSPGWFLGGQSNSESNIVTVTADFQGKAGSAVAHGTNRRGG